MSQNKILKDIAIKLGAVITEKDNDTNELLSAIHNNIPSDDPNTLKAMLDNTRNANYLFLNYTGDNLGELIQYNDTENVTSFYHMYYQCKSTIFPDINTSNGTNFSNMYCYCRKATQLPSTIDTSNGTDFDSMFCSLEVITSLPSLNTSNATSMSSMFGSCYMIKKIDISHYGIETTDNSHQTFGYCYSLKAIIIRSFGENYVINSNAFKKTYHIDGTTDATYNPNGNKDCYIYVPRDMISKLSTATNWSTYASQLRALEDYTVDGTCWGEFDDAKAGL